MSEAINRQEIANIEGAEPEVKREPAKAPTPPAQNWNASYQAQDSRRKSPTLAAILSVVPGLGQIYVGYYQDGFINILVVGAVISILNIGVGGFEPMGGFFLFFFWLYNIIDASRRATLYNQALAGLGPFELPDNLGSPGGKGSLFAGVLLIVFGVLSLAHTKFGLSLAWVEDWWPVAVIAVGAVLIYNSIKNRQQSR